MTDTVTVLPFERVTVSGSENDPLTVPGTVTVTVSDSLSTVKVSVTVRESGTVLVTVEVTPRELVSVTVTVWVSGSVFVTVKAWPATVMVLMVVLVRGTVWVTWTDWPLEFTNEEETIEVALALEGLEAGTLTDTVTVLPLLRVTLSGIEKEPVTVPGTLTLTVSVWLSTVTVSVTVRESGTVRVMVSVRPSVVMV